MYLPIIWMEKIPLLQVYLSHFIAKQDSIFIDICFKQGTQFCSACSSIGLIYYGTGRLEDIYHTLIILLLLFTMKFFCIFFRTIFPKKCIFLCSGVKKSGGI